MARQPFVWIRQHTQKSQYTTTHSLGASVLQPVQHKALHRTPHRIYGFKVGCWQRRVTLAAHMLGWMRRLGYFRRWYFSGPKLHDTCTTRTNPHPIPPTHPNARLCAPWVRSPSEVAFRLGVAPGAMT